MILLAIILRSIVGILSYPTTMILFWVVMAIVYFQYTRLAAMERQWTRAELRAVCCSYCLARL